MIRVYPDEAKLHQAAANLIAGSLESAVKENGEASFVMTGGNTPRPVYEMLSLTPYASRIPWERIHFFWGDERCVSPDDPQSNYGMAWKSLISRIPVAQDHVHRMLGEMEDVDRAARRYEAEIRKVMSGPREPSFDLVLLGMGDDGHTASLFPGTEWDEERLVAGNYVPKLGTWRISMTPRLLNAARAVVFLVAGAAKSRTLAGVLEGPQGSFPAQRIAPAHGTLTWFVDAAAARDLEPKGTGTS